MVALGSTLGAMQKIERARRHLLEWDAAVAAYWATEPYYTEVAEDPANNKLYQVVRVRCEPPVALALVAGDVVHNARSALDHLAHDLVLAGGGYPSKHTSFPITEKGEGWGSAASKSLKGAKPDARQVLMDLRPWKGGDPDLWQLHHLDIVDKHRLLLVALAQMRSVVFGGTTWKPWPDKPDQEVVLPEVAIRVADRAVIHDGYISFSQPLNGESSPLVGRNPRIRLDLAFGPGVETQGEVVGDVLLTVVRAAEATVQRVAETDLLG